jgi:hypothetical protein
MKKKSKNKVKKPLPKAKKPLKKVKEVAVKAPKVSKGKKAKDLEAKANRLLTKGKERGFVTYDEILKEFPTVEDDIIFLDELYSKLQTAGIDVIEGGGMLDLANEDLLEKKAGSKSEASYDSIQMYLK